ncbi:MAG: type ISP restriction/modification enzyme [Terriglobales bacterium]
MRAARARCPRALRPVRRHVRVDQEPEKPLSFLRYSMLNSALPDAFHLHQARRQAHQGYYEALERVEQTGKAHEGAVRSAFENVLTGYGKRMDWRFIGEYTLPGTSGLIRVDGALLDDLSQKMGFWEAKGDRADLERETKRKIAQGYPKENIIFQAPRTAILYQRGVEQGLNRDISAPKNLAELLKVFFDYRPAHYGEWKDAIGEFKQRLPEFSAAIETLIEKERRTNQQFISAFEAFYALCRKAINPNLTSQAVERMLVQHILTERIFRQIFHNPDFTRKNVIAHEVEKVIDSLTHRAFNRDEFLAGLDHYYRAIEHAAENTSTYTERQDLLNTVYERFFQGYSPKEADTHGIVYTPQPIVDFMVRSVEDILKKEFGRSLADKNVHILDPFVGTGNFIVRVMRQIAETDKGALPYKYGKELHCNEVMLLPYYIASMNIEHEYLEQTGEYEQFEGICLVDTFDMAAQSAMFAEKNLDRIEQQRSADIFVAIGNPPYNAWQVNENDNNRNRRYDELDRALAATYGARSAATNKSALSDPYVKAIKWASDRIGKEGVVAFVTNNGFVSSLAADGMRECLAEQFDSIYVLDLGGNVRKNLKLSGTTHNVFGIQVGVSINVFVKHAHEHRGRGLLFYHSVQSDWTRYQKYRYLENMIDRSRVEWRKSPATREPWNEATEAKDVYLDSPALANEETKAGSAQSAIFAIYGRGVETTRDRWLYSFEVDTLRQHLATIAQTYNAEVDRWQRYFEKHCAGRALSNEQISDVVDNFVTTDEKRIKWSSGLKFFLRGYVHAEVEDRDFVTCLYRPFTQQHLCFNPVLVHRRAQFPRIFPKHSSQNCLLALPGPGSERAFQAFCAETFVDLHISGAGCSTECFPFYIYSEDGAHRRENITDWALDQFRSHYRDRFISKWDIFHYVYAVLHHPEYRSRYAANLKRELPRIPFLGANRVEQGFSPADSAAKKERALAPEVRPSAAKAELKPPASIAGLKACATPTDKNIFWRLAGDGKKLAELHVHYESQPEYPLEKLWNPAAKLDYRVTKMRLSKDKSILFYNEALTLKGIPPQTYEYRLGNRSALEWVIDQYQISTDKRSGITNDPNRADDPQYILRLIGQVITVSLETVNIVNSLPEFVIPEPAKATSA